MSKNNYKEIIFETLVALGGKKEDENSVKFIKPHLTIADKDGIKYTVDSVKIKHGEPVVNVYRYDPEGMKIFSMQIQPDEFEDYEPV